MPPCSATAAQADCRRDAHARADTDVISAARPRPTSSSAAALPETADAGAEYVDSIFFLGDQALKALKDDGMLTGTDANKQVWVPADGRLPLQGIDETTYRSPVTGNNAPAADIALVNKPAVMIIFPSPDNANMVTRDDVLAAYGRLITAIQGAEPRHEDHPQLPHAARREL